MHFDQRTQRALRDLGLDDEELGEAAESVAALVEADAVVLEEFFADHDTVYSDMDQAHSASEYPQHDVDHLDTYTHADELRGWLRFESWGVYVEDGRVLAEDLVELTLGPTVHDRVRFAPERERLE
ncbi:hypothetical protein GCM10028857_14850 [Salinarchaeum chitinilyticum]